MSRLLTKIVKIPAVVLAVFLTGMQIAHAGVIEDVQKRGKLIVGLSTFVPWAMRAKNGDLIGFEIDVANQLAADMGVEVEFQPTAFDGIIPALLSKKFDMIVTGMALKPKRNLSVNFTNPYAYLKVGMAANKAKAEKDGLKTLEDWNSSNVILTIKRGTAPGETVARLFPKAKLRQFDDDAQALQDVLNGNAHGFLTSEPKPTNYVLDSPDVLYHPFGIGPWDPTASSIAVRKGDPDALNFLNNWILYRTLDNWLPKTHDKWFKTRDWQSLIK
ncbi:MAG: transporter substrate-binding domain-containing protein [Burkholderiaceae bacterium]